MVSSLSRMSFSLAEIPKIFKMRLFLNANLMADVRHVPILNLIKQVHVIGIIKDDIEVSNDVMN